MTDIRSIAATRDLISQRTEVLRGLSRPGPAIQPDSTAPGSFAAVLSNVTNLQSTTALPAPFAVQETGVPAAGLVSTLSSLLGRVNATQVREDEATEAYQTGESNDIAKVALAEQEASVAFEATLQVRNKLLAAYQEILRMQV
ncbi:flagellar hook-basal body complex protein FliE [Novosphingobium sp. PS1R-30]|uniref:Flagellar hook-basal body complex protein FliE n=1 Tax=Novosphingobium anseongense TaxID=3133436 RepID=A0ABU8RY45_9SPHN